MAAWLLAWLSLSFPSLVQQHDHPVAPRCKDEKPNECAEWASMGECKNNPTYMLAACPDSCTRCSEGPEGVGKLRSPEELARMHERLCQDADDDCVERAVAGACHDGSDTPLRCQRSCRVCRFQKVVEEVYKCSEFWSLGSCKSQRMRCARPPDTPPAVTKGGIGATMQRILSDFPEYSPRAISQPGGEHGPSAPWVVTLRDFLSDAEVEAFTEGCADHFQRSLAGDQLSPVRTSSQCWCQYNRCANNPLTQAVAHRIANLTQVPGERYFEPFQILRYQPGQFYKVHHDQNSGLFTPQGARVYTFFSTRLRVTSESESVAPSSYIDALEPCASVCSLSLRSVLVDGRAWRRHALCAAQRDSACGQGERGPVALGARH